jgi:hypothetical protein
MTLRSLAILLLISLLLLVVYTPRFYNVVVDDLTGISQLLSGPSGDRLSPETCQGQNVIYFPVLAACMNYLIQNDTGLGHQLLNEGYRNFPEKSTLLDIYQGRLFWREGNYPASCEKLKQAGDYLEMQALAQSAFDQENWLALETYLGCIGSPTEDAWGFSTPKISVLFHNLGKHFEQVNQIKKALWSYQHAINWYPTVWADPVLAAARILENHGLHQEAESLVSHPQL